MNEILSDEETSTVTVVTEAGAQQWQAGSIDIDEGALIIGAGEKDGVGEVFAIYAKGCWQHAGMDDHRARDGQDHAARAAALEDELRVVLNIATGRDTIGGPDALAAIRERVSRILSSLPGDGR